MTPLAEMALSLALEAHAVEAARIEDVRPTVDVRAYLSPAQQRMFDCDASVAAANAGRRGGKTVEGACELIEPARTFPNSLCVYLSLTSRSARRIMWPVLKETLRGLHMEDVRLNEHTMEATFPNGSIIVLAGTDDLRTIESWRGTKLRVVVVDEAGSQPVFLEYLLWDILKPALSDLRGKLRVIGTPSPRMTGHWFDMTGEQSSMGIPVFRWTMLDNPHFPDPEGYLASVLAERGWTADHPTYRREYHAEWCDDPGALVYPFDLHRNQVSSLPTVSPNGLPLREADWRHTIGADVGVVDACAFSVTACHPLLTDDYIVFVEKRTGMLTDQFRKRLVEIRDLYKPARRPRVDTGGMGKVYAEDCTRRGVAVEPAEKREKEANIRLFRDRLLAGRTKVLEGKCDPLLDEWASLGWDADRRLPSDDHDDHAADATLYSWRDLQHYREADAPRALTPAERLAAEEQAWIDARLKSSSRTTHYTDRSRAASARR